MIPSRAGTGVAARRRARPLVAALAVLVAGCRARPAAPPAAPVVPAPSVAAAPAVVAAPDTTPPWPQGEVRTVRMWSPSLGATKAYRVWLPPRYAVDATRRYPVAFYLHGLYGDEANWFAQGRLARTLDSLVAAGLPPMLVVTPDGDDGWWTTTNRLVDPAACRHQARREAAETYCVAWGRYDEYVARDLVAHVDSTYRTRATRASRAVAGLSMGGYGAVTLAVRYPEVFAAAASHSGVLSPMYDGPAPFAPPGAWIASDARLAEKWRRFWPSLGIAFGSDTAGWWARDPARLVRAAQAAGHALPALHLDAGTSDGGIIDQGRAFHHQLRSLGVPHVWREHPGAHDWAYWRTHAATSAAWIAGIVRE